MDKFPYLDVEKIMTNQLGIQVGVISLDRSDALNALNKPIIIGLKKVLSDWVEDDSIELVIIKGKGNKAYCAGGDIKSLYDDGNVKFLGGEYKLDFALYSYPKPIIHILHGYVMGGGMGLMNSGALRFSFPDAQFAMPETAIGFLPDVGMRYYFSRMPQGLGAFFALTGARMKPQLAKTFGLIDQILPAMDRGLFLVNLYEYISKWSRRDGELLECLKKWSVSLHQDHARQTETPLEPQLSDEQVLAKIPKPLQDWCDFYWDYPQIPWYEDIFALAKDYSSACEDLFVLNADGIDQASPLSLFVTDLMLRRARDQELETVFNEDYWVANKLYRSGDLREGIKSKLIERRLPNWKYSHDVIDQAFLTQFTPPEDMPEILKQKMKWRDV